MSPLLRQLLPACARSQHMLAAQIRRVSSSAKSHSTGPPKTTDDSTSAFTYKQENLSRPPPLPITDLPRAQSAEEAVTNILYNTPPPSTQPFKKHILNCLVQNEPGVLSRVSGTLAGRNFNIDSLVVCQTEIPDLSRMTIVLNGQDGVIEQARRQLEDLVPVWAVLNYTDTRLIERELVLAKVSILGPEYLPDQLVGGPSHEPSRSAEGFLHDRESEVAAGKNNREMALAAFQHSGQESKPVSAIARTLTPSEALRIRHQHLGHIRNLADHFNAKVVDVSENSVIVEMSGKTSRVEAFLALLKPFGLIESARTGLMVMPRTPLPKSVGDEDQVKPEEAVNATLLPPG